MHVEIVDWRCAAAKRQLLPSIPRSPPPPLAFAAEVERLRHALAIVIRERVDALRVGHVAARQVGKGVAHLSAGASW